MPAMATPIHDGTDPPAFPMSMLASDCSHNVGKVEGRRAGGDVGDRQGEEKVDFTIAHHSVFVSVDQIAATKSPN